MGVLTALASIFNMVGSAKLAENLPGAPAWAATGIQVMGGLGLLIVLAIAGMWRWMRFAVYLFTAAATTAFVINLMLIGIAGAAQGLIGAALVLWFVSRQWQDFR